MPAFVASCSTHEETRPRGPAGGTLSPPSLPLGLMTLKANDTNSDHPAPIVGHSWGLRGEDFERLPTTPLRCPAQPRLAAVTQGVQGLIGLVPIAEDDSPLHNATHAEPRLTAPTTACSSA